MLNFLNRITLLWHLQTITLFVTVWHVAVPVSSVTSASPGETTPQKVEIEIGDTARIHCHMNTTSLNDTSSSLGFYEENTMVPVPRQQITILNASTILFTIRNATEQNSNKYTCRSHNLAIGTTNVYVGTRPMNITDFTCRGLDYEYTACSFTKPRNMIHTTYQLIYAPWNTTNYYNVCEFERNNYSHFLLMCNLTKPSIRYIFEYYNFTLTGKNSLGSNRQSFIINLQNSIIPARPDVKIMDVTSNSLSLFWKVLKFGHYRKDILEYEIRVRPFGFDWIDVTDYGLQYNETNLVRIEHLDYAYRSYNISVRAKVKTANNDGSMWSDPFVDTFRTAARRPDNPPKTDVSSFCINTADTNLSLYWQQLPEYRENGPNFSYIVTDVKRDGKSLSILPTEIDRISATFPWNKHSAYEFAIRSRNEFGESFKSSFIHVSPMKKDRWNFTPQWIRKVYHNRMYTLSWSPPENLANMINYTVFWCISRLESPNQCKSTINFRHLDKNTRNFTTEPQNHTLNLAISANYVDYSTGMHWAMCTAEISSDLMKLDPEINPTSSRSIKVQWSSECIYTSILEGYNLTYCRVANNVSVDLANCLDRGNVTTVTVTTTAKEYEIIGLKPYSTYKISIFMFSAVKKGPTSEPFLAMTNEEAPTPPRNLDFSSVTSNSANISWLPPKQKNGNMMYYSIWLNNELQQTVNNTDNHDSKAAIKFKLENLSSFSEYQVFVKAHTVEASLPSNVVKFKTLIGKPSSPLNINVTYNSSSVNIQWDEPLVPSGRVEFYEVAMTVLRNNVEVQKKICRVKGTSCATNRPECVDPQYSHLFEVRAVNVAAHNEIDENLLGRKRKRRHSNAEISSAVVGGLQTYEYHVTTDRGDARMRQGRHERENFFMAKTIGTMKADGKTQKLKCIGQTVDLWEFSDFKELFHSNWKKGKEFICGAPHTQEITLVTAVIILLLLATTILVYWARKKYIQMKNIGVVMPEGLADHLPGCMGFDNTIEKDTELARGNELFYQKEKQHLLPSTYLNKVGAVDGGGHACVPTTDTQQIDSYISSDQSSQSTDSMELNDINSSYNTSLSKSPIMNGQQNIEANEMQQPLSNAIEQNIHSSNNGYIKPAAVMMPPAPHTTVGGGYILPQSLQRPVESSFSGYTTLEAMREPSSQTASQTVQRCSNATAPHTLKDVQQNGCPPNDGGGNKIIYGYVTHKQLSDFGQRQQ